MAKRKPPSEASIRKAKSRLIDAIDHLNFWNGKPPKECLDDLQFGYWLRKAKKAKVHAYRRGLARDPEVAGVLKAWKDSNRVLGQWDILRDADQGIEAGVKRPTPRAEFWLWEESRRLAGEGKSQTIIRKFLINKLDRIYHGKEVSHWLTTEEAHELHKRLRAMKTRQGFSQLLQRIDRKLNGE